MVLLGGTLLGGAGWATGFVWRQQRTRFYRERKQAAEALRESEERHRTILQTAMDGFWLVDTQGRLLEVNEAYCRMSGYSEQELLAMRIPDLEAIETAEDTAAHIQKIMAQGEDRFESRHRRKDGSILTSKSASSTGPPMAGGLWFFCGTSPSARALCRENTQLQTV